MIHRTTIRDGMWITIEYCCHGPYSGATDGPFGPKLEPDESAWIEIERVVDDDGEELELSDDEMDRLIRKMSEGDYLVVKPF